MLEDVENMTPEELRSSSEETFRTCVLLKPEEKMELKVAEATTSACLCTTAGGASPLTIPGRKGAKESKLTKPAKNAVVIDDTTAGKIAVAAASAEPSESPFTEPPPEASSSRRRKTRWWPSEMLSSKTARTSLRP